jgi:hypothetical protein
MMVSNEKRVQNSVLSHGDLLNDLKPKTSEPVPLIAGTKSKNALGCGLFALIVDTFATSRKRTEQDSKTTAASIAPAIPACRSIANRRTRVEMETDLVAQSWTMILCHNVLL